MVVLLVLTLPRCCVPLHRVPCSNTSIDRQTALHDLHRTSTQPHTLHPSPIFPHLDVNVYVAPAPHIHALYQMELLQPCQAFRDAKLTTQRPARAPRARIFERWNIASAQLCDAGICWVEGKLDIVEGSGWSKVPVVV
jgi:hypothetical protein